MEWFGTVCAVVGAGTISYMVMALVERLERRK